VQARTNQRSINLGWRFIGFGDAYFAGQKYYDAYSRYKDAAQAAPTLADAYFRQGIALFAAGRYELAAKALRRGLALDPNWPASDFRLDELYGQNQMAKAAHIDALAKAADAQPHNADLLFLLGVALYFNGQADQAATFFQKSNQMAVGDNGHLRPFLDRVKPAEQK